jgi:hypothetical protein
MHQRRRLTRSFGLAVAGVTLLPVVLGAPADAAPRPKVSVEVADTATLGVDGQTVSIEVTASCARRWDVLEALVTVSQPQASGEAGLPLTCTGRRQSFTVTVTSFDAVFVPGDAQASALVLIERRGDTREAQDSEVVSVS